MTLDTRIDVETPEGVELGLHPAGPVVRSIAWAVDLAIRFAIYAAAILPAAVMGQAWMGVVYLVVFAGEWFYPVLFEVLRRGATPGKRALGLQVVHVDGTPVGWSASILRNLLSFVDFLPLFYGFGFASCVTSPRFQRLGDRVADTMVVYATGAPRRARVAAAEPVPPPEPLSAEEQGLLVEFAARAAGLTRARAVELSDHLAPLTGATGEAGLARTLGMATWLQGER